jgi:hypothetical protein
MRRFICLMLALMLCLAMPMTALAATASPGNYAPVGSNPKTGDAAMMELWVPALVISAIALAVVALIYFKKIRKAN